MLEREGFEIYVTEEVVEEGHEYRAITQFEMIKVKFFRNKLAVTGGIVLIILYLFFVIFPHFFATNDFMQQNEDYIFAPPQWPQFIDKDGNFHLRPFVYGYQSELNLETYSWEYKINYNEKYPIYFITRGYNYKLFGLFNMNWHLLGLGQDKKLFLLGTDRLGRDLFSRILFGGRISLTIGLIGVALTIIIGSFMGTLSGYFGGKIDDFIQRIIELLMSFPSIPLWAALAAVLPAEWSPIETFFAISIILSLKNWTGLARQVRAKVLSYREEEYTYAARVAGASDLYIIFRHMLPNCLSHILVIATLSIPGMILAETSLSFLGLGIQPPMTSWGVLLKDAQKISVVLQHPWLMIPGIFVVFAVLAYNFFGDGVRDAIDPYSN
ncbi:MAG: ABC transporter permease [Halanaerobiales bacterium]|nr:ABC transporter permease [Halanaerobiales bacterium]